MNGTKFGISRRALYSIGLVWGLVLGLHQARLDAQEFPTKPVRVVVPNAAGSLNDSLARLVFAKVSEGLGQQFIVENRPGAGGIIAVELVVKFPPDGYVLLFTSSSILVVNPFLFAKLN